MTNWIQKDSFSFSFNPAACQDCDGRCCRGSDGYVWLTMEELEALAEFRKMDLENFTNLYIRTADGKLALQQRKINGEYLCCFFDPFQERCTVYPHRPEQCRTYPFWEDFQDDYRSLLRECPGVAVRDDERNALCQNQ